MPCRNGNASGPDGSRRRRRDNHDESVPSDNTSDSDFVADTDDEAGDDDDEFASDEDAHAPAVVIEAVVPRPSMSPRSHKFMWRRKTKKGKRGEDGPPLPWEEWAEANTKWLDERIGASEETNTSAAAVVPTAEPAPEVLLQLLRFQKEWLAWALA
ncbi:DNA repair protein RAD16 [Hordeum vulgare]|nr:DNA repair protein RAD16 [Hordeum vulgare]